MYSYHNLILKIKRINKSLLVGLDRHWDLVLDNLLPTCHDKCLLEPSSPKINEWFHDWTNLLRFSIWQNCINISKFLTCFPSGTFCLIYSKSGYQWCAPCFAPAAVWSLPLKLLRQKPIISYHFKLYYNLYNFEHEDNSQHNVIPECLATKSWC